MAEGNGRNLNGSIKLIIYVLLGAVAIGSTMYAIGADSTDQVEQNTECIRVLEQDSAVVKSDLEHIKEDLRDAKTERKEMLTLLRELAND